MLIRLTPPARQHRATDIVIGSDILVGIGASLKSLGDFDATVVLYDRGVEFVAKKVQEGLAIADLKNVQMIPVESGDDTKSLAEVDRIAAKMLGLGCGRSTLLIAVGGGMVTDLGGFVASVFMRGIPCVLVPTSMLAMVDAAIGGKTAVNCAAHKNMLGTITHPASVTIDLSLLQTLPDAQMAEGLVEVVKIAAIVDAPLFEWLEANVEFVLKRDSKAVEICVTKAIEAKVRTVETDEGDFTERLYLNFGHTVAHAVEALSQYKMPHGQAVSIGVAAEMAMTGFKDAKRVTSLLEKLGMPLTIPSAYSCDDLWQLMLVDKKSVKGTVRVAVPSEIGKGSLSTLARGAFDALFS